VGGFVQIGDAGYRGECWPDLLLALSYTFFDADPAH